MSVDQMLQRHTARLTANGHATIATSATQPPSPADPLTTPAAAGAEDGDTADHGCYGLLRGIKDRAFAIELRKKDGTVLAVPYALIEQYQFTADATILLRAAGRDITIAGQRLNDPLPTTPGTSLFTAIVRQRVAWVAEHAHVAATRREEMVLSSLRW
jgi:hypothetical protein